MNAPRAPSFTQIPIYQRGSTSPKSQGWSANLTPLSKSEIDSLTTRPNREHTDQTQTEQCTGSSTSIRIDLARYRPLPMFAPPLRESFLDLQKWEGHVLDVLKETFLARLIVTQGEGPDQEAEIYLEEVDEDDRRLIQPGAIFYWTVGYLDRPSGRMRASILRFRRLPRWTTDDLMRAEAEAEHLHPPDPSELEVSLFGPGYGEAIVVHLGSQHWLIVDSCLDPSSRRPAALQYLRGLDVDVANAVKLVVASHWHDDHIRGISTILRECTSARIALSSALQKAEFLKLVALYRGLGTTERSGLDELSEVFKLLEERKQLAARISAALRAIENRRLYRASIDMDTQQFDADVYALSPSDATVILAALDFAKLWPQEGSPKRRLLSPSPNQASVALWCQVGHHAILLSADLERTTDPETGWTAVLDRSTVIAGRAWVFKVAHHGALSGHEPRVRLRAANRRVLTPALSP